LAVTGVVLLVAGQLFEWSGYVGVEGYWVSPAVTAQTSDGFLALLAAAVLAGALGYRPMVSSGYRTLQVLPLVLGSVSVISALNGYRAVVTYHPDIGTGMWASMAGGALAVAAGVAATWTRLHSRTHPDEAGLEPPVEGVFEAVFEVVLAGLAALATLAGWLLVTGRSAPGTLWLGTVSVLLGPVVTLWLWQKVRGRLGVGRHYHPPAS
jgi:hypothetical protein